jgi:hypothetical protein
LNGLCLHVILMPSHGGVKHKSARMNEAFKRKQSSEMGVALAEETSQSWQFTRHSWVTGFSFVVTVRYFTTVKRRTNTSVRSFYLL